MLLMPYAPRPRRRGDRMRRRNFMAGVSSIAVIGAASAQQPRRIGPVVGALWQGKPSAPITLRVMAAFHGGLQEDGYVLGANISIENTYGDEVDEFRVSVNRLLTMPVDIIAALGTPAALAAKRATETIPIVAAGMADPVSDGLVSNLARPSGNLTGNTFIGPQLAPKRLQLLREVIPAVTRVAALQHPHV